MKVSKFLRIFSFLTLIIFITNQAFAVNPALYIDQIKSALNSSNNKNTSSTIDNTENLKSIKLRSPYTNQKFEAFIDIADNNYKIGQLPITCPYTGKQFFIGPEKQKKDTKLTSKKIRSPFTGQMFTAQIDLDGMLTGDISETSLVCPYTGKNFKFSFEEISEEQALTIQKEGFQMVLCPSTKKYFKVFSENGVFPNQVKSPYDSTMVMIPRIGDTEQKHLSDVELIFNETLLKNREYKKIKQFGYTIFPTSFSQVNIKTSSGNETLSEVEELQLSLLSSKTGDMQKLEKSLSEESKGIFETTGFAPITSIPVEPNYILGPDDTIIITIWGKVQQTLELTIDRDGKIILPDAGPIYLFNLTFEEAKELIKKSLAKYYVNISIDITLSRLRTIRVFIMGHANKPGGYILSSRASAFHALFNALGPKKSGSLRNISIKRKNEAITNLDLYNILLKGDKSGDIKLKSNDIIFINPIGEVAGITGAVKSPAIYELKEKISLQQFIETAGGLNMVADSSKIQIIRIENNQTKVIDLSNIKLTEFYIQNGDLVLIPTVNDLQRNFVTIEGNIASPGQYSYQENMTISDLIDKSKGFLPGTYRKRLEILRQTKNNQKELFTVNLNNEYSPGYSFKLKEWDTIKVFSNQEIISTGKVQIKGKIKNPGKYQFYNNMKISDLLFQAGGLNVASSLASAELYTNNKEGHPEIFKIDLKEILDNPKNTKNNKMLSKSDLIIVRSSNSAMKKQFITIKGEVNFPGEYPILPGDRISDIIERAGGYTSRAFLKGAIYTKQNLKDQQLEMAEKLMHSQKRDILKEEAILLKGSQQGDTSTQARQGTLEHRDELLDLISSSKLTGRMVIKISSDPTFKSSQYDLLVTDGDYLEIPELPNTIQVIGSVFNQCSLMYEKRKGISYYINKVGGLTKHADKRNIYLIKSNGEVISNFVKIKTIERGDTIVVPEKFKYKTPTGVLVKDTVQILYQMALGAAVVANLN